MIDLVTSAQNFATAAHHGQTRKYTGEPYINHCREVAAIIADRGFRDEVIAAAWLHDAIEDTDATESDIRLAFGNDVRKLVMEVTDVSKKEDGNRATRKALDREHLAKASPEGQSIKLADLISNTSSIMERDPHFAKVYLREKDELLKVMTAGDPTLYELAKLQAREPA